MKNSVILLSMLCMIFINARSQTDVSGTISSDSTWTLAGSPYTVIGTLTIASGVTLTVESGVVVQFNDGQRLDVRGILDATQCTFTSATTKLPGDWQNIRIGYSSYVGEVTFDECIIEYGGYSSTSNSYSMIEVINGTLNVINGTIIRNSNNVGVEILTNGNAFIENSFITSCSWPISFAGPGGLELNQINDLTNNTHDGIYISHGSNSNSFYLDTASIPYYFNISYTVNSGGSLEIASGNIIKLISSINVEGSFSAVAAIGENIYFTSYKDDNLGGDTNDDGAATVPTASSWGFLRFRDNSIDPNCILKRCIFSYGGSGNHGAVITENASPTIDTCEFQNNYFGTEFRGASYPYYRYNTIGSSTKVPIAQTFDADPVFENNTFSFSDNEYDAIGLLESTLEANAVLKQRDVTGIPNVTYLMLGTLTIPEPLYLIINKGIVIKGFNHYHRIIVQGTLIADGEDDINRIVFTSSKDDNHGNPLDTNKDGTQTNPVVGDWGGIVFEGTSSDTCELNYCFIKYASMPSVYYNTRWISQGAVTTVNADPIITNTYIQDVNFGIYAFQASDPLIQNCDISNSSRTPVALSVSADPVFSGNTFTNTSQTALGIIGEDLGHDGTIRLRNVAGYDSITYLLLEDLTINSGTYVDIDPGVVIKHALNTDIYVEGGLSAQGTVSDTIIFTSIRDDNYGNPRDTEQDGDATSPDNGDWGEIQFEGSSDDSYNLLDYCMLLYGGYYNTGIVTFNDAGGNVQNILIGSSGFNGIRCEGASTPTCATNVEIRNCESDPIAISLKSDPVFSFGGVTMISNGNGSNGIRIIEGTLSSSDTLRQRDVAGVYNIAYIVDQLTIHSDAILTLEPGVVIKFYNMYSRIDVNGALIADGKSSEKIVFTSLKDDSKGGDTNDDGNTSVPVKGDWWCIAYYSSMSDDQNILDNCIINYGGRDQSGWTNRKDYGNVRVFDAKVIIDSCMIEQSHTSALGIYGSADPEITNCEINNIAKTPITMSMFASPVFSDNIVSNLGIAAIGIAQETYSLDATIPVRNFGGYDNITYYFYVKCTINSGTIINVPSGIVFKSRNLTCLQVEGGLLIDGDPAEPVVFTHEYDDQYGNPMDTNEDGSSTTPTSNNTYYSINFSDISDDTSYVRNTIFRYQKAGINLEQASPGIKHSTFDNCYWGVILRGVSNPYVDTCVFNDLTYAPIQISLVSYPVSTEENVISGSTYKAIGVLAEELVQDVTLTKKDFAGIEDIPYFFEGDYSIGTSVVLTIEPGVVMKFNQSSQLTVKRGLMAEGGSTADSIIVFTDYRDDFYGGDTNSDSTATTPTSYKWDGIYFNDQSLDAYCVLDHCVVRHAGNYNTEAAITVDASSPTITNSIISNSSNGMRTLGASDPLVNYCDIYDNEYYGIENVNKAFNIDAMYNWWGSFTGPTHILNPGGTGDEVTDSVNYANFITVTQNPLMGDVSLNGYVQAYDASLILQDVAAIITLTPEQEAVADVSGTDGITAYDASLILQYIAGNIDAFPVLKSAKLGPSKDIFNINAFIHKTIDNYEIIIDANQLYTASALQMEFSYNSSLMTIERVEKTYLTSDMMIQYSIDEENGKVIIAMADAKRLNQNGEIVKIVLSNYSEQNSNVEIVVNSFMVNETKLITKPLNLNITDGPTTTESLTVDASNILIYPNPVSDWFAISFSIKNNNQKLNVEIYDITGKKVVDVINKRYPTGEYIETFNINSVNGVRLLRGQYLIRFISEQGILIKRLLVD